MTDNKYLVYGSSPFVQSLLPKTWNKIQRVGSMMIMIGGKLVVNVFTFRILSASALGAPTQESGGLRFRVLMKP